MAADSSTVDVNVVTNAVDASGSTVISITQSDVVSSSTIDTTIETGGVGPTGPAGQGIITGGTTGQVLAKNSNTDFDMKWANAGSGSGITRTVVVTSGNVTAGATTAVDYTYLIAGAHVLTLPTAISNTNRYTVKNDHSADITINTTSSQTVDGTTSIQISPEDSVDIISDNSNWRII